MEVEKFVPKRIQKDLALDAVSEGGERLFLPGDAVRITNGRYYMNGKRFVLCNLLGNTLKITNEIEGQTHTIIGCLLNEKYNTFIYFLYNSLNNHRIVEYDPVLNIQTTLVSGALLGFQPNKMIDQAGCIDDLVIWNPRIKPIGKISLSIARAGGYAGVTDYKQISLYATPPTKPPTIGRSTDATKLLNRITNENWQFSYNYIYKDNSESCWSPFSKLAEAKINASATKQDLNRITVTLNIDPLIRPFIKVVQYGVRNGNTGDLYVFSKRINPPFTAISTEFFGTEALTIVPTQQAVRLQDDIPNTSDAMGIIRNRIFTPLNSVGFDVDISGLTFTAQPANMFAELETGFAATTGQFRSDQRYFKDGSSHGIGYILYDEYNRPSFVQAAKYLTFDIEPPVAGTETFDVGFAFYNGIDESNRKVINWGLTGSVDPKFKKFQLVITKDSAAVAYQQFQALPYKYARELGEGEPDNTYPVSSDPTSNFMFSYRGKVFIKKDATSVQNNNYTNAVYLRIPLNPPFIPSSGDIVRITDKIGTVYKYEFPVIDMIGDYIVIGKDAINSNIDWADPLFIEVYRPGNQQQVFYEYGECYDIVDGVPAVTSGLMYGDTYIIKLHEQFDSNIFFYAPSPKHVSGGGALVETLPGPVITATMTRIESPSNVKSPNGTTVIEIPTGNGPKIFRRTVYSIDYARIAADYGRPHTQSPLEQNFSFPNTFGFSEPYVQDSNINGLTSFLAANKYSIPMDRSKITAFKPVGDVMVAMHERNTSSLYVGEGFIRQGQDFILAKTDSVVGDDRKLVGGFGCQHPESMLVAFDQMYFWDGDNGCVCRYTNAGNNDISRGMSRYFYAKSRQLQPYYGQYKVITAFDYENKEFILTFTPVTDGSGNIVVPGETWVFDYREEVWAYDASYIPEFYGTSKSRFLAFLNGNIWQQNSNQIHNNFFGVQYDRKWRFVMNRNVSKRRTPLNIHIAGPITNDPLSEDVVVRAYTPDGQETFIPAYEFEFDEGKWKAPFLRDINTQNLPANTLPLRSGTDLEAFFIEVEVINNRTDESPCSHVNAFYKYQEYSI